MDFSNDKKVFLSTTAGSQNAKIGPLETKASVPFFKAKASTRGK
ncbi:hypothetical protein PI23P_00235 [Polaribacter irgensii 23-P]|uniref:Uncharacterized protein n=1 Tax=Polaribacter irgensii 23-P TaxID=313594 RepID=A4C2R3_9FLAO|nr:hypothetical protein PI23P_00235 [Polaribacter irgensii 23-P]